MPGKTLLKTARSKTSYHARTAEDSIVSSELYPYCSWPGEFAAANGNKLYFCHLKGQVNLSRNIINGIIIVRGAMHWFWLEISQMSLSYTPRK